VNLSKVKVPEGYSFPPHVAERARDFQLCWFLIKELGVAAIPPTEFYTQQHEKEAENYLRQVHPCDRRKVRRDIIF
jgi:kynurenine aminotransferase